MEYVRYCPKCNKELKTTNKYYFNKAIVSNSLCSPCSLKGRVFTEDHKENLKKNHADIRGEKNPFYKKKHSDEAKKNISDKIKEKMSSEEVRELISRRQKEYYKTHDNPFKGKNHSAETKSKISELSKQRFQNIEERRHLSVKTKEWHMSNENSFKGARHSDESRKRQRISAIKRIERTKFGDSPMMPNYNPKEVDYFKKLESEMGLDGIYIGKNEYQYKIESLGYFPDFYDPHRNIIVEYDEKHHYIDVYNNILKESDIRRQWEIIKTIGCKFYRYNETLDKLYEVVVDEDKIHK
jgi:hypothetical protein